MLAGVPFFDEIFRLVDCRYTFQSVLLMNSVEWKYPEGHFFDLKSGQKQVMAIVKGKARNILLGERPALNMMARASGIATRYTRYLYSISGPKDWLI